MASEDESAHERCEALTRSEKLSLIRGTVRLEEGRATGTVAPVERLDVPPLRMADGPLGVRLDEATAFPASLALGASFDPDLAREFGEAIGCEARAKGMDVLLAPGCNLIRVPHCGRKFEYYGEDPHHGARIVGPTIEGIQSRGVAATAKHYVANSQEADRATVSAEVGERALRELYLPAFEAAAEADVGSVMAAYNRIGGVHATEHERLLTDVLKDEFGFDGPVMSDWWAVNDGVAAARAGTDLEMPGVGVFDMLLANFGGFGRLATIEDRWPDAVPGPGDVAEPLLRRAISGGGIPNPTESLFAEQLPAAMADGTFPEERLDEMVRRVLTLHDRVGSLDGDRPAGTPPGSHRDLARRIATRGTVLLENDGGVLPLAEEASVAVIGPNVDEATVGGGGSSEVTPVTTTSPIEGISARAEGPVTAAYGHPPIESASMFDAFSLGIDLPFSDEGAGRDVADAERAARSADVAVVVVQDVATEARDRESLALPGEQDQLVRSVAAAADRTVVVLQTSGPVELPWIDEVDAALSAWYPGQEVGGALADVLYGDADPGGRLPVTFAPERDYPASSRTRHPGVDGGEGYPVAEYDEGVFVGYRGFDADGIEPTFPFGHGLSYAEFAYRDATVESTTDASATVSVTVANVAERAGREVIQAYVGDEDAAVPRPPRELAGFASVELDPDEERTVELDLDDRAFAYYDEDAGEWTVDSVAFTVELGRSSRDARATVTVER
ncbi:beta-glucosidase [Halorarum halobium]|uniref:beta-glucosidase n=1 Tax=Halorarum halobium TaxID=3075121 RepID=UPI0028A6D2FB|nr:glycoside hydrolase family 3 C-terminal domain-containing protein [Halobaculum sp. XH14]